MGRLLVIPIAARLHPGRILLVDLGGSLLSLGLISVWSDSLVTAWIGTLEAGLFLASVFPTTLSLTERQVPITDGVTGWFLLELARVAGPRSGS